MYGMFEEHSILVSDENVINDYTLKILELEIRGRFPYQKQHQGKTESDRWVRKVINKLIWLTYVWTQMSFIASYYTVVGCYDSFGISIAHWGRDIMLQVENWTACVIDFLGFVALDKPTGFAHAMNTWSTHYSQGYWVQFEWCLVPRPMETCCPPKIMFEQSPDSRSTSHCSNWVPYIEIRGSSMSCPPEWLYSLHGAWPPLGHSAIFPFHHLQLWKIFF